MYWDYWEEKGQNTPGWETQERGAERWKGKGREKEYTEASWQRRMQSWRVIVPGHRGGQTVKIELLLPWGEKSFHKVGNCAFYSLIFKKTGGDG